MFVQGGDVVFHSNHNQYNQSLRRTSRRVQYAPPSLPFSLHSEPCSLLLARPYSDPKPFLLSLSPLSLSVTFLDRTLSLLYSSLWPYPTPLVLFSFQIRNIFSFIPSVRLTSCLRCDRCGATPQLVFNDHCAGGDDSVFLCRSQLCR